MAKTELTKEKITELKKKHGELWLISFQDGKEVVVKKPSRQILKLAMSKGQTDPLGFAEVILQNCIVAGDEEIAKDDDYFLSAAGQLEEVMAVKDSEIKKL